MSRAPRRDGAEEAWRTAVGLPLEFVSRSWWQPLVLIVLPISIFVPAYLGLPPYSALVVAAGVLVAVVYAAILHFFASELALRPVIEDIFPHLPDSFSGVGVGAPLRWKLLGALPLINVVTGVVVSGLSNSDRGHIGALGLDVAVAVVVAFTISLELTLLVTRSVIAPVRDLLQVTERVRRGDLSARAPVLSGDELGELSRSFNAMLEGLQERERLREAFGSYVDPDVAERVLEEGAMLEGEEAEVSIVFIDICDFTAFAERASARETVAYLNDFFGLVVPLLNEHGGHANKFVGDGVLGVFGAPDRLSDHADRALAAACAVAIATEVRYGDGLRAGVGVNSGPVSAGSIGGGGRLEFTVVGDAVNVAARVEQATRELGDRVLITEATRCLLTRDSIPLEPRGTVELKGKSDPVPIWSPDLEGVSRLWPAVEETAVSLASEDGDERAARALRHSSLG
ncbi:MAG: adenylate/guanylate cyclase domain-containing protein [Actinobacteria bacterium]|nr:MAG: adenylate/guanylate cyclase domain-containing protein [Actinomycetota bacterium]